ncbi:MAG: hypothetical protein ACLS3V_02540 [Streptococcus sp.]
MHVSVPRRRWDISIQADLVEEIARIYGYENCLRHFQQQERPM